MNTVTDQVEDIDVKVILRELNRVLRDKVSGDVVELGCYEGGSAVAMQKLLKEFGYEKKLWLYDSFEGLPEKTVEDFTELGKEFTVGKLKASQGELKRNFTKTDLKVPEIKKAWFFELDPEDLPEQIALAFLDGDYYESIMDSLKLVWPKMTRGGVVLVDDYNNAKLPGVRKAVDEWTKEYKLKTVQKDGLLILNA
jgi:O-methyltransferase